MKAEFERQLNQLLGVQKERKQLITDDRYNELLAETKEAIARRRNGVQLSGIHYRRLKRFDVITVGDGDNGERLVQRNEKGQSSRKLYFCMVSEMFDVVHKAHLATGHKKEKGMELELKRTYCNITREVIGIYLNLCTDCGGRRYTPKADEIKAKAVQESQVLASRCQVDIIDMEREPDGEYKYILIHQDHNTKFLILRALRTKTPEEVADILYDIFCIVGTPNTMCCNIERNRCNEIHRILSSNWNVKPERIELPAFSTNQASKHIHKSLREWMSDNKIRNWASNLRIIQSLRNHSFHPEVQRTPHEAMFGSSEKSLANDLCKDSGVAVNTETEENLRKQLALLKQKLAELNEIRRAMEKSQKVSSEREVHEKQLNSKTTAHNRKRQLEDRTDDMAIVKCPTFKVGDMVMVRLPEMNAN